MSRLIKFTGTSEGEILNKWIYNRMIKRNQNILLGVTGSTGSGKSYGCLRIVELWYKYHFKKDFPIENCCFSIDEVMRLLNSKKLKRGEIIILEEGGVNLGALDFQNKVSKLFTYVLQSFRSLNVGLIINLPILNMLNKSARFLIHGHLITVGIDYQNKTCKFKPFFHQVNQQLGKIYPKYPRVSVNGRMRTIKRFNYSLPNKELIEVYENKKLNFVSDLTADFVKKLDEAKREETYKMARNNLTARQQEVYNMSITQGMTLTKIARKLGVSIAAVHYILKRCQEKGFNIKKIKKS